MSTRDHGQSEDRPTLHKPLMDAATRRPLVDIEKRLVQSARDDAAAVSDLVWQAYREGVRDGFVQGVQAAQNPKGSHE